MATSISSETMLIGSGEEFSAVRSEVVRHRLNLI